MTRRSGEAHGGRADPLAKFRQYLDALEDAILARDGLMITGLLRKRIAMHMPREVREELLAFSRMSRDGFRAPIHFLRFQHRMRQLSVGNERMLTAQTELELETPDGAAVARQRPERSHRRAASVAQSGS